MSLHNKHPLLRFVLLAILVVFISTAAAATWIASNYKSIAKKRIPRMVLEGSDSIYHISFNDISVSIFKHTIKLHNVKLWADTLVTSRLRAQGRYSPNTVSFINTPLIEANGINWGNIFSAKTFNCSSVSIHDPLWFMETIKHHPDMSDIEQKSKGGLVSRVAASVFNVINASVTYHYVGDRNRYYCYLKGGTMQVHEWAIDKDLTKDTSVFLYGKYGSVRPASFELHQDGKIYSVAAPKFDFTSTASSIIFRNMSLSPFINRDINTSQQLESYDLHFPSVEVAGFNWKRLLHHDILVASTINAVDPAITIHYFRSQFPAGNDRTGNFPNQLIHQFIKTNVRSMRINNATIVYNEPNSQSKNVTFTFDNIDGNITNITNIDSIIRRDKTCSVSFRCRFLKKSPVTATLSLSLADSSGHFVADGTVANLDGDDITEQAAAFTFAKVTSFHLSHLNAHIEGNEHSAAGRFTILYKDLKISLFKFRSDTRKDAHGPFSFIADALLLYPDNPMEGKEVRTATTAIPRDPSHGFIYLLWQSMYLGAQKTAVRSEKIIAIAGDKETPKEEPVKKKGFFKKLFGRHK